MSSVDPGMFWYIKLRDEGDRRPIEKWGGYSQNFLEADNVYSHAEVVADSHTSWGICGIRDLEHGSRSLLIFDLDVYKDPEFDATRVGVPDDTFVVRSQSGGVHIYFAVHSGRGGAVGSDFAMTEDLEWDIDIRGSYVKHHVVAPNGLPGCGGPYEIANDDSVAHVFEPPDACERITLDGEPLLEYDPDSGVSGNIESGLVPAARRGDPPDEMPRCYHAGLELRQAAPDSHPNTHKVNSLTALCGLHAGYDVETMVKHFIEEYPPGTATLADRERTVYHLTLLAEKVDAGALDPPAISTLRDWGILEDDEHCECPIPYHNGGGSSPNVPRCPDCNEPLPRETVVDGNPALRHCRTCDRDVPASESV